MSKLFTPTFDMEVALLGLREGKDLTGKDSILTPLITHLTKATTQAKPESHFASAGARNRKNGRTSKTMKGPTGTLKLDTPRDRPGTFEPQIVKIHQTQLTDELERKDIVVFALGNNYQDIRIDIADLYGIALSNDTLDGVNDKLLPELQTWRECYLEAIYPVIWLDAIHYKINEQRRSVSKANYTLLSLTIEGKKELLGLYLFDQQGAHHWLSVLTDLYNCGVKDTLIACVNELKGFPEAVESIYLNTHIQHCIIHLISNSMKDVASMNRKAFIADLKCVYKAATPKAAESALDELETKRGDKCPMAIKSWRAKRPSPSAYYEYLDYVRTAAHTTNAAEAVHGKLRKPTKTKGGLPNDKSLQKLLYAGIVRAPEHWTHPVQNWTLTLSQL